MAYILKVHREVEKQLSRVPHNQRARIITTIRSLSDEPRPVGCVKLGDILYRVRQGQYRIIYAVFDQEVIVVICKVARRAEDTYRNLTTLLERAERVLGK